MLEQMRRHSRSFIIYIFFGIIIAVFVINFGPQSSGCVAETVHAGQINGEPLSLNDLNYALAVAGIRGRSLSEEQMIRLRALVVDRLIVRELLAQEATERGLNVPNKEIDSMLLRGRYLALGEPRSLLGNSKEALDYELFSRHVRWNWGITVVKFKEQQRRELLAEKIRQVMNMGVKVSPEEAKQTYEYSHTRATLSYVRFDPSDMKEAITLQEGDVEAFAQKNAGMVKDHYESNKATYKDKSLDQVKTEIANKLLTDQRAKALAKERAEEAVAKVRAGALLSTLFKTKPEQAENNPSDTTAEENSALENRASGSTPAKSPNAVATEPEFKETLQKTGPFLRSADDLVPGVGISSALTHFAFSAKTGDVVDTPAEISGAYYIAVLSERSEPDMDEWKTEHEDLVERAHDRKWYEQVRQYEQQLCERAVEENRVSINPHAIIPPSDPSSKTPTPRHTYVPCQTLSLL